MSNIKNIKNIGFSLIEILIVLVIIGITFSLAIMSYGDFGQKRRVIATAQALKNNLDNLKIQSALELSPIKVCIETYGYTIWHMNDLKHPIKTIHFPKNIIANKNKTIIFINPDESITAYTINLGTNKNPNIIKIYEK